MRYVDVPGFGTIGIESDMPPVVLGPVQQRWIGMLRVGQYAKGKRVLHNPDDNTYCCLGVACSILGLVPHVENHRTFYADEEYVLTPPSTHKLGLRTNAGAGLRLSSTKINPVSLTGVNDSMDSFEAVIWLLENLSGHFFKESK